MAESLCVSNQLRSPHNQIQSSLQMESLRWYGTGETGASGEAGGGTRIQVSYSQLRLHRYLLMSAFSYAAISFMSAYILSCRTLKELIYALVLVNLVFLLLLELVFNLRYFLYQRFDPDPAARAAAATILASKLGADSGLKVYVGDESHLDPATGKSNDMEIKHSQGLRNRKQPNAKRSVAGTTSSTHHSDNESNHSGTSEGTTEQNQQMAFEHFNPQGYAAHDGSWISRIAALLVGEDPTQSYALICGNCHMHNGLCRKEDFEYTTYYCPHCRALNKPKHSGEQSLVPSANTVSLNPMESEVINSSSSTSERGESPVPAEIVGEAPETTELS
ncbi:hypothetical protein DY000_02034314 [Brassica cretica]|uniref:Lunapark zinc ribbon domain-containing protein n=1 Tax=Brassica cretica TaxID=69181 RepID=A0ABQ7DQ46_BRACR|nr:hypothetical protein DY000_02034314 [Brassica cretica]